MKCKFCFTKLDEVDMACGVCKIEVGKNPKELTKEEKRRKYFCRALRIAGLLTLLGSAIWFTSALSLLWLSAVAPETPDISGILISVLIFAGGIFLWVLGMGLRRYKKWSYYGGMITYTIFIVLNLVRFFPLPLLLSLLVFYYIVNRESRAILLRAPSSTVK